MTCRTAERIVTWALLATAACSGDNTGPSAPKCSSALASQLTLAVGAYASIDPATDGGCVAFPAKPSAVDSAEYLLVPQSAAPTFGLSSPFALRAAARGAGPRRRAQALAQSAGPPTPAGQFDGLLRRLGSEHAARAGAAAPRPLPAALRLLPAAAPPALGSLRQFTVCANATSCGAPADFKTIGARVRAVGAHVAICAPTARTRAPMVLKSGRMSRSTSILWRRPPGSTRRRSTRCGRCSTRCSTRSTRRTSAPCRTSTPTAL